MAKSANLRKRALTRWGDKLAQWMVTQTYTDEQAAQALIAEAIKKLDQAGDLLESADRAFATSQGAEPTNPGNVTVKGHNA